MTSKYQATVSSLSIKIDNQALDADLIADLESVQVQNDLHLPDVATIRFQLNQLVSDKTTELPDKVMKDYMSKGSKLQIADDQKNVMFDGEIVSVGVEYAWWNSDNSPMMAVAQAYDMSHRLHRGRKTRTFLNQKYSDIASKIASEAGLSAKTDATSTVYEYILQANQTDWELIQQMAARVGYTAYVSGKDLNFKKANQTSGVVALEWGKDLLQFRVRASTASQVAEVTVRGWDVKKKEAIVGKSAKGEWKTQIGDTRNGADQAKTFGTAKFDIVDVPVVDSKEAETIAKSLKDALEGGFLYAEGMTATGMGDILPGKQVEIKNAGTKFSGKYLVTSTTHRYSGNEGYTTSFVVNGRQPDGLAQFMESGSRPSGVNAMQGVVTAIVTNNEDADDLGRVKVKFPWMMDDKGKEVESWWVRVAVPDAGPQRGFHWLPEVNDEVLVAFEHGDISRPFIIGSLWNGKDKPPQGKSDAVKSGKVAKRMIKSRSGHMIVLDDTDGSEQIIIQDKTGKNSIVINSKENTLTIAIDKDITINAKGKATIETQGDTTIKAQGNMNLEAGGNMTLKATGNCNVEATGNLTAKGAQTTVEGTGRAEVKAATVSVNGSAMTEVKGGLVRIN